ncbi:hypothetical protein AB0I39_06645 [Kitasatospora purpeofusca]|uniref:hypothetical protein n=1 Tax=Kitasatospora purpeofusca TaxID=67352 RepID=UPI0033EC9F90
MRVKPSIASGAVTPLLAAGLLILPQPAHAAGPADLYATVSASALAGTVTYRTHFDNAGPNRAAGTVTATLTLPSQTTGATVDFGGCTYDNTAKVVTCDLSGMPVGQGVIPVVTAQISPLAIGALNATAAITGTDPDPDTANNTATANCTALTSLIITC